MCLCFLFVMVTLVSCLLFDVFDVSMCRAMVVVMCSVF